MFFTEAVGPVFAVRFFPGGPAVTGTCTTIVLLVLTSAQTQAGEAANGVPARLKLNSVEPLQEMTPPLYATYPKNTGLEMFRGSWVAAASVSTWNLSYILLA